MIDGDRLLVMLDPGADPARRDVYRVARERGVRVALVSRQLTWETSEIDHWICADPSDIDRVAAAVAQLPGVAGIVNCTEDFVPTAASLTHAYGLPGLRPDAAVLSRDKVSMGRRLRKHGLRMALRWFVTTREQAIAAAEDLGGPGVLKPVTGVSSMLTARFESPEELAFLFDDYSERERRRTVPPLRQNGGRWLVEEYLDGPGFSVESVVRDGCVAHVAVCEKGPMEPPYFRETGHSCPARAPGPIVNEMLRTTEEAIAALKVVTASRTPSSR